MMAGWSKRCWPALVGVAISWSTPGLSQIFYNKQADERSKAALEEYRTSRDAHLGIFKTRKEALTALGVRLDDAIGAAMRGRRDAAVIELIDLRRSQQVVQLKDRTDERLKTVTGFSRIKLVSAKAGSPIDVLVNAAGLGPRIGGNDPTTMESSFSEESAKKSIDKADPGAHSKFVSSPKDGGKFTYKDFCLNRIIQPVPEKSLGEVGTIVGQVGVSRPIPVAAAIIGICHDVGKSVSPAAALPADEKFNALKALAGYEISPGATELITSEAVVLGQQLGALKTELDLAKGEIRIQTEKAAPLKAARERLEAARKNGAWDQFRKLAAELANALGTPGTGSEAAPAEPACGDKITLQCARAVAAELGVVDFDRLRASTAAEIAGYLADPDALTKAADGKCGKPGVLTDENRRICLAFAGMETLRVIDQARDVAAGRPGQLAELALLITDAESRVADAQARSAGLIRRIDNLAAQRQALVTEIRLLMDARGRLDLANADPRGALLIYARSYDEGRLPYSRLFDRQQLLKLQSFNEREEQVVRARYAIADGLLQTVSTATASGLKPADAAGFLSAIGITTLGITEAVK